LLVCCCDYGSFSCGYDLSALNVRLLLIGNIKLWHITAVILILDLMQFRLDNTGGHISLGGAFWFSFIQLLQRN
jgi:hypothetical protein